MSKGRKLNNIIAILALIAVIGIMGCAWLLFSAITEQSGSFQILSTKERANIGKK